MPATQGPVGKNMGNTNKELRDEIQQDIINSIQQVGEVMRTQNSIFLSDNFHLDAVQIGQNYKVEIQYKKGTKQTVSVITLARTAQNVADIRTGLSQSLKDGHIWNVT
jgi:hypothetical protein